MTEQNYEEAAKAYSERNIFPDHVYQASVKGFLAGAQFAHAAREKEIAEAHNAAIDKALTILQKHNEFHFMDGTIDILNGELEKLKI